jgi:hypothetical protein
MKYDSIDILDLDEKIKANFFLEKQKIPEYENKVLEIDKSIQRISNEKLRNKLLAEKQKLLGYIRDIKNETLSKYYTCDSHAVLEEYKKILNKPIKVNFSGKMNVKNTDLEEKEKLIHRYILIAQNYISLTIEYPEKKINCNNCTNKKDFVVSEDDVWTCCHCSSVQIILKNLSSYRDTDRINITSKYLYDRRIHFRECLAQYQAKQNSTIPSVVYESLEKEFELHHLLVGTKETSKEKRFKAITKEHVLLFLKELGYSEHYENVHLIHYHLTGKKPNDISHLENKLLQDFDMLIDLYDRTVKHTIDRKSFINSQNVLYQLLLKHKYTKLKKEDFNLLRTNDRQNVHDSICKYLFENLGWNFEPIN